VDVDTTNQGRYDSELVSQGRGLREMMLTYYGT
jgi:hypothetical protein